MVLFPKLKGPRIAKKNFERTKQSAESYSIRYKGFGIKTMWN